MANSRTTDAPSARLERATPILRVRDLQAGIEYYSRALGFGLDWQDPEVMGSVSRDGAMLMLCQGDQGHSGGWVWLGVDDVERLFREFQATGAVIRVPPTSYPWGREMQVEDPDGNVLRFGSDSSGEGPFGAWLDMRGQRWERRSDGSWARIEGGGPAA